MKKTLTVVAPVYNEEELISTFYTHLKRILNSLEESYETSILFIVDRSSDNTVEIIREIANQDSSVRAVIMSARFGHQMSLMAGIDVCDSDVIIMMDSDLQHPPELIPTLIEHYEKGYDIVYTLREDTQDVNFFKRVTSKAFYRMINSISETPINESAADFRLISRRVARVFREQIRERNQFLRGLFEWVGFKSIGVNFRVRRRHAGRSKYSIGRMVKFGLSGVVSFSKSPLEAAVIVGFLFAMLGFLTAIVTTVQYFMFGAFPSGWATLVILISIFSGTQLIFLGITGEYIGAIFDEVKARPHYIVEERINIAEPS